MNCNCKMGEICENWEKKLQSVDWTSPTGKKYRIYLDIDDFETLLPGLKDLPESEQPTWGCHQLAWSRSRLYKDKDEVEKK